MKKLLLLTFLLTFTFSFAQQNTRDMLAVNKNTPSISLTSISAAPNPFSTNTRITFKSSKSQLIKFTVKSLLGKTVYITQINAKNGLNSIPFNRNDIIKGMYIYTLQSDSEIVSKRLVIR